MTVRFPTGKREAKKGADMDSAVLYLLTHFETLLGRVLVVKGCAKKYRHHLHLQLFLGIPQTLCVS